MTYESYFDKRPPEESTFNSFLRFLGRPGWALRDVLGGNFQGAARQGLDFAGDIFDSALPGDLIPEFSRKQDFTEASDLVGGMEDGWAKTATDIVGGIALDPLTYLSFGAAPAANAAAKGLRVADRLSDTARAGARVSELGAHLSKAGRTALKESPNFLDDIVSRAPKSVTNGVANNVDQLDELEKIQLRFLESGNNEEWLRWAKDKHGSYNPLNPDEAMARSVISDTIRALESGSHPNINTWKIKKKMGGFATEKAAPAKSISSTESILSSIDDGGEFGHLFNQGGMRFRIPFTDIGTDTFFAGKNLDPLSNIGSAIKKLPAVDDIAGLVGKIPGSEYVTNALNKIPGAGHVPSIYAKGADSYEKGMKYAGDLAKKTFGYSGASAAGKALMGDSKAVAANTFRAAKEFLAENMPHITSEEGTRISNALHGISKAADETGKDFYSALDDGAKNTFETFEEQSARFNKRLDQLTTDMDPERISELRRGGELLIKHNMNDYATSVNSGSMTRARMYTNASGDRIAVSDLLDEIEGARSTPGEIKDVMKELGQLKRMGLIDVDTALAVEGDLANQLSTIEGKLKGTHQQWANDMGYTLQDIPDNMSPSMYLHRSIQKLDEANKIVGNKPNALKKRVLTTPQKLADHLNLGETTMSDDLGQAVSKRASYQGDIQARAYLGRQILGDTYNSIEHKGLLDNAIEEIGKIDPDLAREMAAFNSPMPARGKFLSVINKANRAFKPFAVYGALIPKMSGIVRNKLGQPFQAASEEVTRSGAIKQLTSAPSDLLNAVKEGYGPVLKDAQEILGKYSEALREMDFNVTPNQMGKLRADIDAAFKAGNGQLDSVERILKSTNPDLAEAVKHGILDGYVRSEELVKALSQLDFKGNNWKKKFSRLWDAPGVLFNSIESNARLGMFMHLRNEGLPASNAALGISDAFLDYSITSPENRTLRDLIPFAAFLTGSVKQQAKLVSRSPGVGVAANQVFGQDDDAPVYPWLSEQAHMRLPWDDNEGNPYYAAGFGLPIEALNSIPNLTGGNAGEEIKRTVIGSSSPLLKTAYSFVSGKDPYFDSDYGSYKKDPLTHQESELGGYYNQLAGTGLIQPVDSLLRTVGKFTDDRKGFGTAMLDSLTGVKVQSVDEKKAFRQILREYLDNNPDVGEFSGFYAKDGNAELKDLIQMMSKLKN